MGETQSVEALQGFIVLISVLVLLACVGVLLYCVFMQIVEIRQMQTPISNSTNFSLEKEEKPHTKGGESCDNDEVGSDRGSDDEGTFKDCGVQVALSEHHVLDDMLPNQAVESMVVSLDSLLDRVPFAL